MGIIDPMTINSVVASGAIDFSGWTVVWLVMVGVLVAAFGGILFASLQDEQPLRRRMPRLTSPHLGAAVAMRAH